MPRTKLHLDRMRLKRELNLLQKENLKWKNIQKKVNEIHKMLTEFLKNQL